MPLIEEINTEKPNFSELLFVFQTWDDIVNKEQLFEKCDQLLRNSPESRTALFLHEDFRIDCLIEYFNSKPKERVSLFFDENGEEIKLVFAQRLAEGLNKRVSAKRWKSVRSLLETSVSLFNREGRFDTQFKTTIWTPTIFALVLCTKDIKQEYDVGAEDLKDNEVDYGTYLLVALKMLVDLLNNANLQYGYYHSRNPSDRCLLSYVLEHHKSNSPIIKKLLTMNIDMPIEQRFGPYVYTILARYTTSNYSRDRWYITPDILDALKLTTTDVSRILREIYRTESPDNVRKNKNIIYLIGRLRLDKDWNDYALLHGGESIWEITRKDADGVGVFNDYILALCTKTKQDNNRSLTTVLDVMQQSTIRLPVYLFNMVLFCGEEYQQASILRPAICDYMARDAKLSRAIHNLLSKVPSRDDRNRTNYATILLGKFEAKHGSAPAVTQQQQKESSLSLAAAQQNIWYIVLIIQVNKMTREVPGLETCTLSPENENYVIETVRRLQRMKADLSPLCEYLKININRLWPFAFEDRILKAIEEENAVIVKKSTVQPSSTNTNGMFYLSGRTAHVSPEEKPDNTPLLLKASKTP